MAATTGGPDVDGTDTLPGTTRRLLDAVTAISSDLDLGGVLSRIVESAAQLAGARYGALGVIGSKSELVELVTTGVTAEERALIGDLPRGHGVLGLLADDPRPVRIADLEGHPRSVGVPPGHPRMRSFLGVPVRIRGTVFGILYLTEKTDGGPFTEQDQLLVEALAGSAGFVIDNARAYGLSERRRQWLEASAELAESLQPPIELDVALAEVARSARSVTHATATAVLRLDNGAAVHTVHPASMDPVDRGQIDAALHVLDDEPWPRGDQPPVRRTLDGLQALLVPLRTHLVGSGLLVILFAADTPPLSVDEQALLTSFADQAGLALDRAQAIEDRAELAVTSDRERIARDLHDQVIQRLFATGLQLQGVGTLGVSPPVMERIDRAIEALDLTIKDIRGTIFELQHRGSTPSLRADLRELVREYTPLLHFDPTISTDGPVDTAVPPEIREQLLPVLREALSNLARHAAADQAEIELLVDDREVRLSVLDNGVGLGSLNVESGLRNARRRANALGGSFELGSRQPRGTAFVWRAPLG